MPSEQNLSKPGGAGFGDDFFPAHNAIMRKPLAHTSCSLHCFDRPLFVPQMPGLVNAAEVVVHVASVTGEFGARRAVELH
jgi:hypothetical protein